METKTFFIAFATMFCFSLTNINAQNVGINATGALPDNSALLDLSSNNKGLLIPRMTSAERDAIPSPAVSLIIYNTICACTQIYAGGSWIDMWCAFSCCTAPPQPPLIVGNMNTTCSSTQSYNVSGVSALAVTYTWAINGGGSIVSGQGTANININWGSTGTYTLSVIANNSCGTSVVRTTNVTVTGTCCPLPTVGAITGTSPICENQSGIVYTLNNVVGVTYTWAYSGAGFSCTNNCTSSSITANFTNATSGNLSVTPTNTCGIGATQTFAVSVTTPPTVANAGPNQNLSCGATTTTLAANAPTVGAGLWTISGAGTATITTPTSPTSGITNLVGAPTLTWTITNVTCTSASNVNIAAPCSTVFTYTGAAQTFTVPAGISSIIVTALGAQGGGAAGGNGGSAKATIPVTAGEVLYVYVGQMPTTATGGYNGGGNCINNAGGNPGGGASDVRRGPYGLVNRLIVAGGGGGQNYVGATGGVGGANIGGNGSSFLAAIATGGTQIGGGGKGTIKTTSRNSCLRNSNIPARDGRLGFGGDSGILLTCPNYGGGGGGGYYGGAGGYYGSGAGGSNYVTYPGNTATTTTAGVNVGNGQVKISW